LTDRDNPKVIEYIEKENDYSENCMEHTKPLQKLLYMEFLSRLDEQEESPKVLLSDGLTYFSRRVPGQEYKVHCRMNEFEEEEVYLDENELAAGEFEDANFFKLAFVKHSPDCGLIAYAVDSVGNERNTVYFMNMDTKQRLDDKIEGVHEDLLFSADGEYVGASSTLEDLHRLNIDLEPFYF
jgi:oligopeptidase B